jgi:hypothetical protein
MINSKYVKHIRKHLIKGRAKTIALDMSLIIVHEN